MKITALLSAFFHLAIVLFAWLGLPSAQPMPMQAVSIEVEIVSEDMLKARQPKTRPKPPAPIKKQPPPPPPKKVASAPPEPPKPAPIPEKAIPIPDLKPKPVEKPKPVAKKKPAPPEKARPRPKAKPKPKLRKIVKKPPPKKLPKTKPKPPPKNDFASVLKTVSKLKAQPRRKPPEEKKTPDKQKTFLAELDKKLQRRSTRQLPRLGAGLSNSELDSVRRQIEQCWNVQAGARGAENMVVEIRMVLNPDGRVRSAQIEDTGRMRRDPFYRAMAESAKRAVLNRQCQPLRLPLDKYDEWQVMVLKFDPRGMF